MILVAGLGNFPPKYDKTRHNLGFMAVDFLVEKYGLSTWKEEKKFFAQVSVGDILGEKIIAIKPQTFMNLSGKSVAAVKHFYKIPDHNMWIFSDDLDLEFGETRFRQKGSSGGQKGVASIIQMTGTSDFPRIKFGIANEHKGKIRAENFVLSKFLISEQAQIPDILNTGISKFLAHLPSC